MAAMDYLSDLAIGKKTTREKIAKKWGISTKLLKEKINIIQTKSLSFEISMDLIAIEIEIKDLKERILDIVKFVNRFQKDFQKRNRK